MSTTFDDAVQQGAAEGGQAGPEQVEAGEVKKRSRVREERYGPDGRRIPGKRSTGNPELYKLSGLWRKGQAKQAEAAISATLPTMAGQTVGDMVTQPGPDNGPAPNATQSQFLARQGVNLAQVIEIAPDAVALIGKIVRGKIKAPIGLRLQAAIKVLDAGGINAAVGERIEAALKAPGGASLQSLAAKLVEASNLARQRAESGQKPGTAPIPEGDSPL